MTKIKKNKDQDRTDWLNPNVHPLDSHKVVHRVMRSLSLREVCEAKAQQ